VSAAPSIVDYATETGIDLIVMGTHGRRGVRHLLVGSVTEEVVRLAPCAVLSVRMQTDPKPLSAVRNVLAPVDFSEHSRDALGVARDVAGSYGARLQLFHVWEDVLHPAFYNMGAMSIKDLQPDIEDRTIGALQELLAETPGPAVETDFHTTEGHAAREIVDFAVENATDLIVIATHGLTGVEHFLLGSVAEKVVRRAPCPVLVVKRRTLVE
jgi:nucleotide-binding universal stress UspA family protein